MGNPAREKEGDGSVLQIGGIEQIGAAVEIIPGMVEGHDDHDDSPEKVDGFDAGRAGGRRMDNWGCRRKIDGGGGGHTRLFS